GQSGIFLLLLAVDFCFIAPHGRFRYLGFSLLKDGHTPCLGVSLNITMMRTTITIIVLLTLSFGTKAQNFNVSYSSELLIESFSGSILLYLSKENPNPKDAFLPIELPPVYRVEALNLKPNEEIIFDDSSISYPVELSNIERGEYFIQAVFDRNLGGQFIATSPGNLYSEPIKVTLDKDFTKSTPIVCTRMVQEIPFNETERLKELKLKSSLLTEFHNEETFISGAVQLPEGYYESDSHYPVIFSVFGFGGNYKIHSGKGKYGFSEINNEPAIVVYLDGNCKEGHSTYANSDINGPWGDALVKEFIPELSKRYRTNDARFLFGHSSGGWTVLWLQINYPNTFAGCWASAPDQVDFRNWQGTNIYEDSNKFYSPEGAPLYDLLLAGKYPIVSANDLYTIESVVDRGEQFHSFDAVFSARDKNNEIRRLVNMENGSIDNATAHELFRRYDISYQLRNNWAFYEPLISNKIRISVGTSDNFHLNKAVELLEDEMKKLDASIEFKYFPGDHFTVFTDKYSEEGQAFLDICYQNWIQNNK
ncbi:alpha/beta hydrolase-fold protein, partial [Marinoscillum sp. MHG1-6]|uniref:alpha/beta hydrolase-fold protein n=1 Tax=Marinoscillum sp. MHG1-6 TaxID=2959627 RepID=UPI00215871E9